MKQFLLILSCVLIGLGSTTFIVVLFATNFNLKELSDYKYSEYEILEDFSSIEIMGKTSDVKILPSNSEKTTLSVYYDEKMPFSFIVEGDVLKIIQQDNAKWYQKLISFGKRQITLYLSQKTYNSLTIKNSTGDVDIYNFIASEDLSIITSTGEITVKNSSFNNAKLEVSTGDLEFKNLALTGDLNIKGSTSDIEIENSTCSNAKLEISTGDIDAEKFILSGDLSIIGSTSDVKLSDCDCANAKIKTISGSVKGHFLTPKNFITSTISGKINIPQTSGEGICEISTKSGSINFR